MALLFTNSHLPLLWSPSHKNSTEVYGNLTQQRTFNSPLKSVTFHVDNGWASVSSRSVPLFPNANSWSMYAPSPISAGVPIVFGTVTSLQWYLSIWCSGCWADSVRRNKTQNGSIRKWTLKRMAGKLTIYLISRKIMNRKNEPYVRH